MASSFLCPTDKSETECQSSGVKLPCCGAATIAGTATVGVCFDPATAAAYKPFDATFVFKCNDAIKAGLSMVSIIAASMYI